MLVPAAIFALIAGSGAAAAGWGIPMATDIAFALGVLALLGTRIPVGLKVLLLGLAIVDDIGAIIVIGIFYADSIAWGPIAIAVGTLLAAYALRQSGVWYIPFYVALGLVGWFAMMESGVHPTLIGVAFGLLTPWRAWYRAEGLVEIADGILDRFRPGSDAVGAPGERGHEVGPLLNLSTVSRRSVAPLDLLEHELHPLVAFVIVPAFAFANAGVPLSADTLGDAITSGATIGVAAGLVVGKPLGIVAGVWVATRIGARLPDGVTWPSLAGIGMLAGIGFTVSLLIADLAYENEVIINQAKLGILFASVLAGVCGYLILRATARGPAVQEQ
jgi:NhaA family Na+:H+ antiporter